MKQGTTQSLKLAIGVDLAAVDTIIFTIKATDDLAADILLQKRYPHDTEVLDGTVHIMFTQEETALFTDYIYIEGQVNFVNKAVGKTATIRKMVSSTLFTDLVPDNAAHLGQAEVIPLVMDGDTIIVRGIDGKDGAPGAPGRDGINGKDGAPGPMGPIGPQGPPGLQGVRGEKGESGAQGIPGKDGAQGPPGAKGDRGLQGEKGDKGDTGTPGIPGKDGTQGVPGEKGDRGEPGADYVLTSLDKQEIAGLVEVDAPTKSEFTEALDGKEPTIDKLSAFNRNFADTVDAIKPAGTASTGVLDTVPRADHVHPAQKSIPYAENGWNEPPAQLVLDTNNSRWQLKWSGTIHSSGNYGLDITFGQKWHAYSYDFSESEVIALRNKSIDIGVTSMVAPTGKLELVINESSAFDITPQKLSRTYVIPDTTTTMTLRAVVFGDTLSMSFTGLYMHLTAVTPEETIDFTVRKILQTKLSTTVTLPGTIVITETGGLYLSKGTLGYLPLAGTPS